MTIKASVAFFEREQSPGGRRNIYRVVPISVTGGHCYPKISKA